MAIIALNLDGSANGASVSSINTASITPVKNSLILVPVASEVASPNTPTISGCSLTWAQIATKVNAANNLRLTLFRGLGVATTGALTIDFGGQTQGFINYGIDQFIGTDTSGTSGSEAIVQSASYTQASGTTPSVTLSPFSNINNATYGVIACNGTIAITEGSGFSVLDYHATNISMKSQWKSTNDTSVDWTIPTSIANAIAVEIKFGQPFMGMMI